MKGFASAEEMVAQRQRDLERYKEIIDSMSLKSSDRKKLLALPFAMSKRAEKPEPKTGTSEMKLYEELSGNPWNFKPQDSVDEETKITEYDYENYLDPEILAKYDTSTENFKNVIRAMNFTTKTQHEASKEN